MTDKEQYARGYAEVDLDAILSNMRNMKAHIRPETKMIGVIKTDAYGHGSVPVARALQKLDLCMGLRSPRRRRRLNCARVASCCRF